MLGVIILLERPAATELLLNCKLLSVILKYFYILFLFHESVYSN